MTYRFAPVFHTTAALMILLFAVRASVCFAGDPAPTSIRIEYRTPATHKPPRVEVIGLSPHLIASLRDANFDQTRWNQVLALYVATEDETANQPMLGEYAIDNQVVVFQPRFPLRLGLEYRAVFRAAGLQRQEYPVPVTVTERILLPKPPRKPTVVEYVYPSSSMLPENQLKFYIHFSGPMSRGDSYRHVQLIRDDGKRIEDTFLELSEELWNEGGTRFTLFFEPGRIKRGLKPREDVGPSLEEGYGYRLVIADSWLDAYGNPLAKTHHKDFRVTKPDSIQPDPHQWEFHLPATGTREPLLVRFREPLDHALLQRMLRITNPDDTLLGGEIQIAKKETEWTFLPAARWVLGQHHLSIAATLEDLAGNSIGRPFEVDLAGQHREEPMNEVRIPFVIRATRTNESL
jgi:hypothetical protein